MSEDTTKAAAGGVTESIKIADMTLNELVMLSQGFGHQIERLREQRAYLKRKIDERLARGERNGSAERERAEAEAAANLGGGTGEEKGSGDAVAPGALIEASAQT